MRRRFALIHPVLLLALAAQPAFPQTSVGTAWMIPWIDSSGSVAASAFSFDDSARGIELDAVFIDFPPLAGTQSDIPLPPGVLSMTDATVPAVRASFSRPLGSLSVSAGIGAFSFPERKTVIEKQILRIRSDTGWMFDAGVRFRSLSVHSVFAYDSALLFAGGTPVGSADVSFGRLSPLRRSRCEDLLRLRPVASGRKLSSCSLCHAFRGIGRRGYASVHCGLRRKRHRARPVRPQQNRVALRSSPLPLTLTLCYSCAHELS